MGFLSADDGRAFLNWAMRSSLRLPILVMRCARPFSTLVVAQPVAPHRGLEAAIIYVVT